MFEGSCEHVVAYKKEEGIDTYEIIYAFYVAGLAKDSRRRKALDCLCMVKSCRRYQRIHACLFCPYFGCYREKHIHEHAKETGHVLAMDVTFGNVYCFECRDYQYDADFDDVAREKNLSAAQKRGEELWEPSVEEAKLRKHIILDVDSIKGLRGINNLGNTCYMSVIILSVVHAPVFRDYFLSLRHKCNIPVIPSEIQDSEAQRPKPVCFVCEVSDIVQEFYCGNLEPFIPDRLLYLVYLQGVQFRNPGQHCAHEFFIAFLNYLHLHSEGSNNISSHNPCNCFIETIFTGSLHNEFTCEECKWHSIVPTPFTDLYLMSDASCSDDDTKFVNSSPSQSFEYFLKKALSESVCKKCDKCNDDKQHSKMITLKKLPLVMSFHLQQNELVKNNFICFPEFIDMTPFMSQYNSETTEENLRNGLNVTDRNKFYLFAVVKHTTAKEFGGGHYSAYVRRHKTNWFYVSDHAVEVVSLETVLNTKAVMLFYHKETLQYEDKINLLNKF